MRADVTRQGYLLGFIGVLLLSGCATATFRVNVDSIGAPSPGKTSYVLIPGNENVDAGDLQFEEYARYVHRALTERGFVAADAFEDANVAIFLAYGIGEPQEHQDSYSVPTWGQTGVASSRTTGRVSSYGGYSSYSGTTTYTPKYGVTGSTTHIETYTTHFRYMILDAVDLEEYRRKKKEVVLWKTTVTSTGSSGDLRLVFPILVAASKPHIATNTGKQVQVHLQENDKRVAAIKGIGDDASK